MSSQDERIAVRKDYSDLLDAAGAAVLERVVLNGDLATLSAQERVLYYRRVCESLGLNPLTQPFTYLRLNNRLTLYPNSDCADQLRKIHGVSLKVLSAKVDGDLYIVHVEASDRQGRTDSDIAAVPIGNMRGDILANNWMKCHTKAKRRVTLSICGLGAPDADEMRTVAGVEPANIDVETGEVLPSRPKPVRGKRLDQVVNDRKPKPEPPMPEAEDPFALGDEQAPPVEEPVEDVPPAPAAAAKELLVEEIITTRDGFKTPPSQARWERLCTVVAGTVTLFEADLDKLNDLLDLLQAMRRNDKAARERYQAIMRPEAA